MMRSSGDKARGNTIESFSDRRMPTWAIPISRKTSIASFRIGPRHTMRTAMSSQANDCTHAEAAPPGRRSRCTSELSGGSACACGVPISGTLATPIPFAAYRSVELSLHRLHRADRVVLEQEPEIPPEHRAQIDRHDDLRDRPQGERLARVHQLALVALVELDLPRPQPFGDVGLRHPAAALLRSLV